jgi:hypothetical protein
MNDLEDKLTDLFCWAAKVPGPTPDVTAVYRDASAPAPSVGSVDAPALLDLTPRSPGPGRRLRGPLVAAGVLAAVALTAVVATRSEDATTTVADSPVAVAEMLGLGPEDLIPIAQVPPPPDGEHVIFERGYDVEGLDVLGLGRVNPAAFDEDPEMFPAYMRDSTCVGSSWSFGCGEHGGGRPHVTGITQGGADILAWAWSDVPTGAAVVVFTDHDGSRRWQPAREGVVYFPDTLDDPDGYCECTLEAFDAAGRSLATVNLVNNSYIED